MDSNSSPDVPVELLRGARPLCAGLALALTAFAASGPALAAEAGAPSGPRMQWQLSAGVAHSDNATRTPNGEADTAVYVGSALNWQQESARLRADVRGNVRYEYPTGDSTDSDLLGFATAAMRLGVVGDTLTWALDDTFGQTLIDVLGPSAPDNRGNANALSTGPDLDLRLGAASGMRIGGRYSRFDTSVPNGIDDRRYRGTLGFYHALSAATTVSANAMYEQVKFPDVGGDGYDLREYFLTLASRRSRQQVSLDLGVTQSEQGSSSQSLPLVRIDLTRRLGPAISVSLTGGQQYASGADAFRQRIVNGSGTGAVVLDPSRLDDVVSDVPNDSNSRRLRYGRLAFNYERNRTSVGLLGGYSDEQAEFVTGPFDRTEWNAAINLTRRMRPTLTGSVNLGVANRDFDAGIGSDRTRFGTLDLRWSLARRAFASLTYRHERRSGPDTGRNYTENVVYATLAFGTLQ